jgi:hypothetical protein
MSELRTEWREVWYPTFLIFGILIIIGAVLAPLFDYLGFFILRVICQDIFYFGMIPCIIFFFCRYSSYMEKYREKMSND